MELTGIKPGDETFTLGATTYQMLFPHNGGAQGFSSVSPFAPKTQIGPRSYADYNAYSAVAFTDFSGGMGQDRLTDPTKYYDAHGVDTRSGRLILGPLPVESTNAGVSNTAAGGDPASGDTALAITYAGDEIVAKVTGTGQVIYRVWLLLKVDMAVNTYVVNVYNDKAGAPEKVLAYASIDNSAIRQYGAWVCAELSTAVTLTSAEVFWIGVYPYAAVGTTKVYWYGRVDIATLAGRSFKKVGGNWTDLGYAPFFWLEDDQTRVAYPPKLLTGAGKDGVSRMWAVAGYKLFYLDKDSVLQPALNTSVPVHFGAVAECAAWYRASSDTHAYLYIGLGDAIDLVKFDANIGTEVWASISGVYARAMCVHADLLWLGYARNTVAGWDSATLGNSVKVGDATYVIRNMVSWDGDLWVGKDDGLYRVTVPIGYPTTGDPIAQKIIDFSAQAASTNFAAMVEHHGDLIFSCAQGVMRYTAGGILTPIGPETGLNMAAATRSTCRALASSLNVLWATFEAPLNEYTSLMAFINGNWHPLIEFPRSGDMARSIAIEPGWYGETPRIWYGAGLAVDYVTMPMTSQRRWLFDSSDITYAAQGKLDTSWIDGGIRTVVKDWIDVEIDASNFGGGGLDAVTLYWRPDETTAWVSLGSAISAGVTTMDFPASSYSAKSQIRVLLTRSPGSETPIVEAVIVHYMERPLDVRSYTRTYEFSSKQDWRNGTSVLDSLATRLGWLRTLREASEPLTWVNWLGESHSVHIVQYSATESVEARGDQDTGTVLVMLTMQEV
jgi:hypothetical protein